MVVLDASAALAFLTISQRSPAAEAFRALGLPLTAPSHFCWEVRHALVRLERRGAINAGAIDSDLEILESLVEIIAEIDPEKRRRVLALARRHALSVYDAAYLDIALTRGLALASRDGPLLAAALQVGAQVYDLR